MRRIAIVCPVLAAPSWVEPCRVPVLGSLCCVLGGRCVHCVGAPAVLSSLLSAGSSVAWPGPPRGLSFRTASARAKAKARRGCCHIRPCSARAVLPAGWLAGLASHVLRRCFRSPAELPLAQLAADLARLG